MFGQRPGAEEVITRSLAMVNTYSLPLRLVSLVFLDLDEESASVATQESRTQALIDQVEKFGNEQLAAQATDLVAADQASTVVARAHASPCVATARTVEYAVDHLSWLSGELVFLGSSRLASPSRIFLGSTASRMLRSISAPMMIIPATST